nr:TIM44-like domain-containing protein [Clostridia bacterium]
MGFNNFLNNLRRAAEAMEKAVIDDNTNNQNHENNTYNNANIKNTTNNQISKNILEKLVAEDKDFAEAKFRAKVDNMFIQTYTGVMKQDLSKVEHFLSKEMFEKYSKKVENLKSKNQLQIYDELNVSDTNIINIEELEDRFVIKVSLLTKYLDYILTKDTKKYVSGDRDVRVEKRVRITLSKIKNAKSMEEARKCDGCGANMDLNKTGVCEYCGTVFELKNYDWVIENIQD